MADLSVFRERLQVRLNREGRGCGWLHSDTAKLWLMLPGDVIASRSWRQRRGKRSPIEKPDSADQIARAPDCHPGLWSEPMTSCGEGRLSSRHSPNEPPGHRGW